MELEIREMQVRAVDTDERTVTGIAVPYGQVTNIGGYKESFERGAFGKAEDVKLFYGHKEPIGKIVEGRDTENGYEITARISETQRGDEVYTLLRDGVLNKFSVGFVPVEHRTEDDVVVRTKALLKEVSIVAFPAYEGASVAQVRQEENSEVRRESDEKENNTKEDINMSEENTVDVSSLRDSVADLERRFEVLQSEDRSNEGRVFFRSEGEFLKALYNGSEEARAVATTSDADVQGGWVSDRIRLKAERRTLVNLFNREALPSNGNNVEYRKVLTEAGSAGVLTEGQSKTADTVVGLGSATAPVQTVAGRAVLTRQAIERSDSAYLTTTLNYMAQQYAKATEGLVLAELHDHDTSELTLATNDAAGWIHTVVEGADSIYNNSRGSEAEYLLVSSAVYEELAAMVDGQGRPVFNVSGQAVNALGSQNLVKSTMNVGGLTVVKHPGLIQQYAFIVASDAYCTWESAGAPFRLEDQDISNLTQDFTLYGYFAVGETNEASILRIDTSATGIAAV